MTIVNEIKNDIQEGKNIVGQLVDTFDESFTIEGKKISEWRSRFSLKLGSLDDPAKCRFLLAQIADIYSEVLHYKSKYESILKASKSTLEQEVRKTSQSLLNDFANNNGKIKALTNRTHFEKVALQSLSELDSGVMTLDAIVCFFSDIIKELVFKRETINTACMSLGTEAKFNSYN